MGLERLIERFNLVYETVNRAVEAEGAGFAEIVARFVELYGFEDLLGGVAVEERVRLNPQMVLEKFEATGATKSEKLSQPLNELLFFLLFSVRGQLGAPERAHVQRMVNRLYLELG